MKGLFIPGITAEMFRNGCLESIEILMAEGEIYDIDYSPTSECSFKTFKHLCKYYHVGFDQDRIAHDTCRYEANIPSGCSWGECNLEACPFLQEEEGAGNDKL